MAETTAEPRANDGDASTDSPAGSPIPSIAPQTATDSVLDGIPSYSQGLLKIRVPVRVTLAAQRKSIQDIIELGAGAIVKFDKTCDEPLELSIGDRVIATGDVIKVGDKFGVRIGSRR